jgi:hypothetical protein
MRFVPFRTLSPILVLLALTQGQAAVAAPQGSMAPPAPPQAATMPHFDWVQHTQGLLDDLKGKLNLAPGQVSAWDTWSSGVMDDARQQEGRMKAWHENRFSGWQPGLSTPDRMARRAERLRSEIAWMQGHLSRLEAAQARTKTFYDRLDTNQKTIFDLYWQQVYRGDGWMGRGMMQDFHEGY